MDDAKPVPERLICVLEDSPDQKRKTVAIRGALMALPVPFARSEVIDRRVSATRAMDALRPAAGLQIGLASFFIREKPLELSGGKLMDRLRLLGSGHVTLPTMEGYCHG